MTTKHTPFSPASTRAVNECERLKRENAELVLALEVALRYLDHPDVRAIEFAVRAETAAKKIRATLAKVRP